jgi:hypothetical protein|nr:MAG TPA: hypothetical protein [Ackermannviridae sp.]
MEEKSMINPVPVEYASFDAKILNVTLQKIYSCIQDMNVEDELTVDAYELEQLEKSHRLLWNLAQVMSQFSNENKVNELIKVCDNHILDLDNMLETEQSVDVIETIKKNKKSWERQKSHVEAVKSLFKY